jgi:SAM-dependent methyltransferase
MRLASRKHEPLVASRKRRLLAPLSGSILEIGPGDGINLTYYSPHIQWTAYEPNPFLARRIPVPPNGRLLVAPYQGGELADTVVCTLVLCSVPDLAQMLRWIHQSLPPQGRLIFLEHVAAPAGSPLAAAQQKWLRLWRCCAGGCEPTRQTAQAIRDAGFHFEEFEAFDLPLWLAGPHICGIATKKNRHQEDLA